MPISLVWELNLGVQLFLIRQKKLFLVSGNLQQVWKQSKVSCITIGYFFPASSNQTIQRQGFLKVSLQKTSKPSVGIILGLTLNGCENVPGKISHSCTEKQIINKKAISCGTGKFLSQPKICSLYRPFECGVNETCLQIDQSKGKCVCLGGLARDSNGICSAVLVPVLVSSPAPQYTNGTTEEPPKGDGECSFFWKIPNFKKANFLYYILRYSCSTSSQHRSPDSCNHTSLRLVVRCLQAWTNP